MRGMIIAKHLALDASALMQEFGILAYLRSIVRAVLGRGRVSYLACVMPPLEQDLLPPPPRPPSGPAPRKTG